MGPYPLGSVEELKEVARHLDWSYALVGDIDLEGEDWEPIGVFSNLEMGW